MRILRDWKIKREERKQREKEELLQELAEMVDKRRTELAGMKARIER